MICFWRFRNFNVRKVAQSSQIDLAKHTEMLQRIAFIKEWEANGGLQELMKALGVN